MPDGEPPAASAIRRLWGRYRAWIRRQGFWTQILILSCWFLLFWLLYAAVQMLIQGGSAFLGRDPDVLLLAWIGSACALSAESLYRQRAERLPRLPRPFSAFDLLLIAGLYVLLVSAYSALKALLAWPPPDLGLAVILGLAWLLGIWLGRKDIAGPD